MGIFSLFGKKDREQDEPVEKDGRAKRGASSRESRPGARAPSPSSSAATPRRDNQAARETALKIDAIESEMSSEFVKPNTLPPNTQPFGSINTIPGPVSVLGMPPSAGRDKSIDPARGIPTLGMGTTTQFLLGDATLDANVALAASADTAVIEEAAILFANGQTAAVEQVLRAAIEEDNLGAAHLDVWGMLFDLYQITGQQKEFDNLSLQYASKFERSPPAWREPEEPQFGNESAKGAGIPPMVPFIGKLSGASIKQLDQVKKLAESHCRMRLEFSKISEVDPVGCGLLLSVLKRLQKSGHELILVGAPELGTKIRAILQVGRRDETEVPWLLLLEILRLLNLEKEFEEVSMDYCVTFEVSPPAFAPPENNVTTAVAEPHAAGQEPEGYMMPAVIEGRVDELIIAIAAYSDLHDPAVIDCSRLTRVDFNAAARLATGLAPFCQQGKVIEFHNVNYLVAALFSVMGIKDIVRVLPRKS